MTRTEEGHRNTDSLPTPEQAIQQLTREISAEMNALVLALRCPPVELWSMVLGVRGDMLFPVSAFEVPGVSVKLGVPDARIWNGWTRFELWQAALKQVVKFFGDPEAYYRTGFDSAPLLRAVDEFFDTHEPSELPPPHTSVTSAPSGSCTGLSESSTPEEIVRALTFKIFGYQESLATWPFPSWDLRLVALGVSGAMLFPESAFQGLGTSVKLGVPDAEIHYGPVWDGWTRFGVWRAALKQIVEFLGSPQDRYPAGLTRASLLQAIDEFFDQDTDQRQAR